MKRNKPLIIYSILITFLITTLLTCSNISHASTTISTCTTLSTSNELYLLDTDITNSITSTCMEITGTNITLDCQGHTIDGINTDYSYGIYKNGGHTDTYITIKNCIVSDWYYGIYLVASHKNTINDSSFISNGININIPHSDYNNFTNIITKEASGSGVALYYSYYNIFDNINTSYNGYGFYFDNGDYNTINNSFATGDQYYFFAYNPASYNKFENTRCVGDGSDYHPCFEISDGGYNNFTNCSSYGIDDTIGLYLGGDGGNIVISYKDEYSANGIHIASDNNLIKNSTTFNVQKYGLRISGNNNNISYSLFNESYLLDTYITNCNNIIQNITGSGNRPIEFYNSTVTQSNKILSQLVLCDADNSTITNITIIASNTLHNNGIYLYNTNYSNLSNINSSNNYEGIYLYNSAYNNIFNSTFKNNAGTGILDYTGSGITISDSYYNNIYNNIYNNNSNGIVLKGSNTHNNTIYNSNLTNNIYSGLYVLTWSDSSIQNTIYNNLFNNTLNIFFYIDGSGVNYCNISKQQGTRILTNGNLIGGNYWTNSSGDGYSDTCTDTNKDGFCDTAYNLTNLSKIMYDYLPLSNDAELIPPTTTALGVNADGTNHTFNSWTSNTYVNISFNCTDTGGSGCATTYYCTDITNTCTPSTIYTTPVQISTENISHIRYYSTDNAGNNEIETNNNTIKIDTTYPIFTNNKTNNAHEDQNLQLNITITENHLDTVVLMFNNTNYTITENISNEYYFTITNTNYTAHDIIAYTWYANTSLMRYTVEEQDEEINYTCDPDIGDCENAFDESWWDLECTNYWAQEEVEGEMKINYTYEYVDISNAEGNITWYASFDDDDLGDVSNYTYCYTNTSTWMVVIPFFTPYYIINGHRVVYGIVPDVCTTENSMRIKTAVYGLTVNYEGRQYCEGKAMWNKTISNSNSSSYNVTIANQNPTVSQPTLNTTSPQTNDYLNCTGGNFADNDAEDIEISRTYLWYDNNITIAGQTDVVLDLSISGLDKDNLITCAVSVYDGYDYSNYSNSTNTATIVNTAPTTPTTLTPITGKYGGSQDTISISCDSSTDIDGDTVYYSIDVYNSSWYNIEYEGDGAYNLNISNYTNQFIDFRCNATDTTNTTSYYNPAGTIEIDNEGIIIIYQDPTPANNTYQQNHYTYVNITIEETGFDTAILIWNETNNYTMTCTGTTIFNCYYNLSNLNTENHNFSIWANDSLGNTDTESQRFISIYDETLSYSNITPYNNTISITNNSYLFDIKAYVNITILVNGTAKNTITYNTNLSVNDFHIYYNNGTENTNIVTTNDSVTWTYEETTNTISNLIYFTLNQTLNATYTAEGTELNTSSDNYQWNISLNLNMTQNLIPLLNWTFNISYANLSENTGYMNTTTNKIYYIPANTTTVMYSDTISDTTTKYEVQTEIGTYQLNSEFKNNYYKNIYHTPVVKQFNVWALWYWNSTYWIDVTANPTYDFSTHTTYVKYRLPAFQYTTEFFKVVGTDIYVPPSGGGGGGGAPPPISNLTSIIEISPSILDLLLGRIPAPLQSLGTTCGDYTFTNGADYNTTIFFEILGEDYNLDNTINLINLSTNSIIISPGESKTLEICVYYPTAHTETLKAEILVSGTNYAERIPIFMNATIGYFIIAFLKKYGLIITIFLIIIAIISTQNTKSLNKLKYKLGL